MKPAAYREAAQAWLAAFGAADADVPHVPFSPQSFKHILDGALTLARTAGVLSAAMPVIADLETTLAALRRRLGVERTGPPAGAPTAAVLAALDPPTSAPGWWPDVLEHAGAHPTLDVAAADAVFVASPEPLGDLHGIRAEAASLAPHAAWYVLVEPALCLPGPSVYRAVEVIAASLHGTMAGVAAPTPNELIPLVF